MKERRPTIQYATQLFPDKFVLGNRSSPVSFKKISPLSLLPSKLIKTIFPSNKPVQTRSSLFLKVTNQEFDSPWQLFINKLIQESPSLGLSTGGKKNLLCSFLHSFLYSSFARAETLLTHFNGNNLLQKDNITKPSKGQS